MVLATPAFATSRMVRPMDPHLADLCDEIPYASAATVVLAFDRVGGRAPAERVRIRGAEGRSDRHSRRLLAVVEMAAPRAGRARADADLRGRRPRPTRARALRRGHGRVARCGALTPLLGIKAPPLFTRVYRWERANAQHEVGHLARVAAIERALDAHPGLFVTGSGYRGVGIPDCIADGRATARQVAIWMSNVRP